MKQLAVLLFAFLATICMNGCVNETLPDREDDLLNYYMPRTTEYKYLYKYSGFFSGKRDSLFHVEYYGRTMAQQNSSVDGHSPIEQYTVSSTDGERSVLVDLFVSDSIVVDYGTDCTSNAERFVPLKGKLRAGNHWAAANNYKATDNYGISFSATVMEHYDRITVADSISFDDVWQVNYVVSGSSMGNEKPPKEFLPNARRVIYFARGIGKVYEIAYSPQNEKQWQNELLKVERR